MKYMNSYMYMYIPASTHINTAYAPCGMINSLVGKLLATDSRLSSLLWSEHTSARTQTHNITYL